MMKGCIYEGGLSSCLGYLAKRAVLLAAKLLGFKGFCLFLATALLCLGRIGEDVWLTLAITLVCSASGIRVLDSFKEGTDALDAKKSIAARLESLAVKKGVHYEKFWKSNPDSSASWTAPALPGPTGGYGPTVGYSPTKDCSQTSTLGKEPGANSGQPSGAAKRAASRKGTKATSSATKGLGEKGRQRIRTVLEEAAQYIN